jgi:hypothetical protein
MAVQVVGAVIGGALVLGTGWSVLVTLVAPRRVGSRIPRTVAVVVRAVFHKVADVAGSYERRDRVLAMQAPVQLLVQVVVWLALFQLGFALLLWPLVGPGGLVVALEESGSSLFTLGYVSPNSGAVEALDELTALAGLGTVAIQIGYLPTLYAAFARREALVTMLDSRAGVPSWGPELLARTHYGLGSGISAVSELPALFEAWEQWSADVSETHTTYVPLVWFRSPRPLSSWVTAQLAVLDAAALYLALVPDALGVVQARLCLRGGFTCLATVARALGFAIPEDADPAEGISLTYEEFVEAVERLRRVDFPLERPDEEAWLDFLGWRVNYEAAAYALAFAVDAPPARWSGPRRHEARPMGPLRPPARRAGPPPLRSP